MNEKLDFDVKIKKNVPKRGRRAGLGLFTLSTKENVHQEENNEKDFFSPRTTEGKPSSWVEETIKINRDKVGDAVKDLDDGIPVIPNLEDTADEDFNKIAKAPLIGVHRVATYKELENDLLKHTAFASLEEVNLRVLTNQLDRESVLSEPDEPWTKDILLSEVISTMNEEREKDMNIIK